MVRTVRCLLAQDLLTWIISLNINDTSTFTLRRAILCNKSDFSFSTEAHSSLIAARAARCVAFVISSSATFRLLTCL